jgi:hypothetical protein
LDVRKGRFGRFVSSQGPGRLTVDDALDALFEDRGVEVEKKTDRAVR